MAETIEKPNFSSEFAKIKDRLIATSATSFNSFPYYERTFSRHRKYTAEDVERILESGSLTAVQELSRYFYQTDGYYRQIINYYADLLKYVGVLIPSPNFGTSLSTNYIQKRYYRALDYVEEMHLPIFLQNCGLRILIDGSYYGIITSTDKDQFVVMDLPSNYCRTRFKDIYGNDVLEFNVSYFNTIVIKADREAALKLYPKSVRTAYAKYVQGKLTDPWVPILDSVGICFPFPGSNRPPFASLIAAVLEYDAAVDRNNARDAEELRKIIVQQIPHLNDGRLLFEPDEAVEIHEGTVGMMKKNPNVSVLTTYADVTAIQSESTSDASKTTALKQMMQNLYSNSGTSSEIFASTSSATLPTSLDKDLAFMMSIANKFSLFITNLLNRLFANTNVSFKYTILPVSYYNMEEYVNISAKLANAGYSFILPALGLGISQKDLCNLKELENDVLKLDESLIPLKTSYTQSNTATQVADAKVGRPQLKQEEKAEQTIANEQSQENTGNTGASE